MSNLKEEEIRKIVSRATMFQKFYGNTGQVSSSLENEYPDLFEITDSMDIHRAHVAEALLEHQGIPVDEPFILDAGFSTAKVVGFSKGQVDPETLKELRAQIQYHFNTVGDIKHRKTKTIWQAKPKGLSRFIASQNSPEVMLEDSGSGIKITVIQSLKTINKFYLPMLMGIFGSIMFFAASVFGQMGSEAEVGIIMTGIFGFASFLYSRFMKTRRQKKKNNLVDLVERLQHILERRLKATSVQVGATITIPDNEYEGDDEVEIQPSKKVPN